MSQPKPYLLLDVRTPAEFSTGFLPGAINVEYQNISQYIVDQNSLPKDTSITLYCRSGRRTAIAKAELESLGYSRVRDLGSLEMAREILEQEGRGGETVEGTAGVVGVEGKKGRSDCGADMEKLRRGTNALIEGLKAVG